MTLMLAVKVIQIFLTDIFKLKLLVDSQSWIYLCGRKIVLDCSKDFFNCFKISIARIKSIWHSKYFGVVTIKAITDMNV